MATHSIRVSYRPLRIGFVVQWGDISALTRGAEISSLLWGGTYSPILPVASTADLAHALVSLFNPDVLVPLGESPHIKAFTDSYQHLRTAFHDGDSILPTDWQSQKQTVTVLDIIHVIEHYWQSELRHKPAEFKSQCVLVDWESTDPLSDLLTVSLGRIGASDTLLDDYRGAFEHGLRARVISVPAGGRLDPTLLDLVSPLAFTGHRLRAHAVPYRDDDGVYVGHPSDFEDLLNFWNLRAAGRRLVYLPLAETHRLADLIAAHLDRLVRRSAPRPDFPWSIVAYFKTENEPEVRQWARGQPFEPRLIFSAVTEHTWNGLNIVPLRHDILSDFILCHVDPGYARHTLSFPLQARPLQHRRRAWNAGSQRYVVTVGLTPDHEYPGFTLRPPSIPELNEFLGREITLDPLEVRADFDGVSLITEVHEQSKSLRPVSERALIAKLFGTLGVAASPSAPGLLATTIIENMSASAPLWGCRVFKIRGVRNLLKTVKQGQRITWDKAITT